MSTARTDPYKLLEVHRRASQEEIRQAYRRMARKHHPDVSKEPGATARFQEINLAYEILSDPVRRREIDRRTAAAEAAEASSKTAQRARQERNRERRRRREAAGTNGQRSAGRSGQRNGEGNAGASGQDDRRWRIQYSTGCPKCGGRKNPGFMTCYTCRPPEERCPSCQGYKKPEYPVCYNCSHG